MRNITNAGVASRRTAKRGNREGAIYQRKSDGRWCAAVTLENGKRKVIYGKTREEVAGRLVTALNDVRQGLTLPGERLTVAKFLVRWLEDSARPKLKPSTYVSYETLIRRHLVPGLGRHSLAKLSPQPVQAFLNERASSGLSPRRVQMMYAVLRVALSRAVKWGLAARNVALLVDPPRVPIPDIQPLSFADAQAFLRAARGHTYELLLTVFLTTGLRVGEALALRWEDIDLDAGRLSVRHTLEQLPGKPWRLAEPKSATSRRTLPLLPEARAALSAQRARVLELQLRTVAWRDHGLVFPSATGEPPHVTSVSHAFKKLLVPGGLPSTHRLHDLRHSTATYLLAKGVPPRVVMELLGHSQISMTMRYQHVLPAMLEEEVARLATVFPTLGSTREG